MKRIGAARDMCTLRGICAHLGEHQEDLEGRRSSFLFPRVLEPASSSQPDRDSCSGYTTSAGGHSTHRGVTIDENVSTVCDASARRNSRKFQTKKPVHQQVKKKVDVARNKELVRLCIVTCYPETLEIGGALEDPTVHGGFLLRRIIPSATVGSVKEIKVL